MESFVATPDNSGLAESDEDLANTAGTDASVATQVSQAASRALLDATQVPLPAEWQEPPPPPGAGPPTSSSGLTALWAGSVDSQPRPPRRNRRRGKPPLLVGQDTADSQGELVSPKRQHHSHSSSSSHAMTSGEHQSSAKLQEQPTLHATCPALHQGQAGSQAHLVGARSVSPSRPQNQKPPPPEEPPAPAALRTSGSAPSLPPLPPLLAPQRDRMSRSRSVVALQEHGQQERRNHGENFQPLQRTPLFRSAPLRIESEGTSSQGTLPLAPPPPQQPPPQRQATREDSSTTARLAPKLPSKVAGQSESRHWREPAAPALGRLVPAAREGWGDAADAADARLPGTARLSVV